MRAIVSVTNDLFSDKRVHKTCLILQEMGYDVTLVGRRYGGKKITGRSYKVKRFGLLFNKGPLFYACYNIRLFFYLLFQSFDLVFSNDLDTLPANFLISRIKNKKIIYDSHECFTQVPELVDRKKVQAVWEKIESVILPKINNLITVSSSIVDYYKEKYDVDFKLVRNVPQLLNCSMLKPVQISHTGEKVIIYQGALNKGRGLELLISSMKYVKGAILLIAGDGDVREDLKRLVIKEGVSEQVLFSGRIAYDKLPRYTISASLGVSLEEDMGLNYRYALPNKLFDYIAAEIPVLVADLPEMSAVVQKYEIGSVLTDRTPESLAKTISEMITNQSLRDKWKNNLLKAKQELNWEAESKVLTRIIHEMTKEIS